MAVQISHKHECIFVHIPKTGGSTVEESALFDDQRERAGESVGGHTAMSVIAEQHPRESSEYFKFTFVRNPYERLLSAYAYLSRGGNGKGDDWQTHLDYFNKGESFREFVLNTLDEEMVESLLHLLPQYRYLEHENRPIAVDHVARTERFRKEWKLLCFRFNIPFRCHYLKKTRHSPYYELYDQTMRDKVYQLYRTDFERFDYPREITKPSMAESLSKALTYNWGRLWNRLGRLARR